MTAEQRSAIYALVPVLSTLLVAFGVVTEDQAATVGAAIVAILGVLVAFFHRPTKG